MRGWITTWAPFFTASSNTTKAAVTSKNCRATRRSARSSLRELSNRQIAKLGGRQPKPWFGYVSAVYGYDSNITLRPSSAATDESGDFVQVLALGEYTLSESTSEGYHLTFLLLATDFLDTNDFDDDLLTLGAEYRRRAGDWRLDYGLELGKSTFAGEDYVDTAAVAVNGRTDRRRGLRRHGRRRGKRAHRTRSKS